MAASQQSTQQAAGGALPGDMKEIRNSPAFAFLSEMQKQGKLSQAQVDMYKNKFAKLHEMVLATYENEKALLIKAKELHASLTTERAKMEERSNQSTSNNNLIQQLRADLDRDAVEAANLEERKLGNISSFNVDALPDALLYSSTNLCFSAAIRGRRVGSHS
jgi:hypothetical protein